MNNFKYLFLFSFLLSNGIHDISSQNTGQLWELRLNHEFSNLKNKRSVEYHLDEKKLISALTRSPLISKKERSDILMDFPSPEGKFINFEMYESPVMPQYLSGKYPMIKTYTGRGLDNPNNRVSITIKNNEIKGLILCRYGRIFIERIPNKEGFYRISYSENQLDPLKKKNDYSGFDYDCMIIRTESENKQLRDRDFPYCVGEPEPCYTIGDTLVTFRYAAILTAEANNSVADGTVEGGLAWIAAMANQVNLVWIRELSFKLELIENNDMLIYTDANPTPELFTSHDMYTELPRVLIHLTEVIGPGGFGVSQDNLLWEYGAVFNTGYGGGLAYVPGSTSANLPSYAVHIHEIGHNLGSGHNCTSENGWRSSFGGTAMCNRGNTLPGSYGDQYSSHTIDISIRYQQDMFAYNNYDYQRGWIREPTGNTVPGVMVPESGFYIPKETPFVLEGSAIDSDEEDLLTYSWEQNDASDISFSPPDFPPETGPLFCSIDASEEGKKRYFPYMESILENNYSTADIEQLPFAEREINMRLLVRDNNLYSGAFNYKNVQFSVDEDAGPFRVTSQSENELWETGSTQTITWDVANTNDPNSVNSFFVDILLINDSWNNFDVVLAENVANDGAYTIIVPALPSFNDYRIMVKSSDNIFFDINSSGIYIVNTQNAVVSIDTTTIQLTLPSDSILFYEREIGNIGDIGSILIYEPIIEINQSGDGFLSFDGVNDYVDLGANMLSGNGNFSISLWVRSQFSNQVIIQQRNGGFNGEYQLNFSANGQINFWTYRNGYQWTVTSTDFYNDNEWHNIVVVQDASINGGRMYIDGSEIGTNSNGTVYLDGGIHTYLGADMRDYTGYFSGEINDVHIFDGVLSEEEVNALFNGGFGFNTTYDHDGFTGSEFLVASYPIISMQGDTLLDISQNGHDGILVGASWGGNLSPVPIWMSIQSESHWLGYGEFEPILVRIDPTGLEIDFEYTGKLIVTSNADSIPIEIPVKITIVDDIQLVEISVPFHSNWNLVGLPVEVLDSYYNLIFPESIEGTLYSYDGTYQAETSLISGEGYWLRFVQDGFTTITGVPLDELTVTLYEGWNLISGPSQISTIIDHDEIIIIGTLYGFESGYISSDEILPGRGYWIRTFQDGEITLTSDVSARVVPEDYSLKDEANTLSINSSELYFGVELSEGDRLKYSLPPKPPEGAFDVRFKDGWRLVKDYGEVEVMPTTETLTIAYDIILNAGEYYSWVLTATSGEDYILEGTGELTVPSAERFTLELKAVVPATFTLHQNFPNPFNPITSLRYDLPEQAQVTLTIYDLMGREITQLVNTAQEAGYKSVQWNATDIYGKPVSAGVYLYQIRAGGFVQTRKMVLLK